MRARSGVVGFFWICVVLGMMFSIVNILYGKQEGEVRAESGAKWETEANRVSG